MNNILVKHEYTAYCAKQEFNIIVTFENIGCVFQHSNLKKFQSCSKLVKQLNFQEKKISSGKYRYFLSSAKREQIIYKRFVDFKFILTLKVIVKDN